LFAIITISIFLSLLLISLLWIFSVRKRAALDIKNYVEQKVNNQKVILKREVIEAIEFARFKIRNQQNRPDTIIKKEVLDWLATRRFGTEGYIFVNRFDGQALIYDGKEVMGTKSVKNMTDPDGKRIFDMELLAAGKPEGGFMEYKFKKMDGDSLFPKMSFVKKLSEWNWIIGAGDYLDTLTHEIAIVENQMKQEKRKRIGGILLILFLLIIANFLFTQHISRWLDTQFDFIKDFLLGASQNTRYLNLDHFRIKELVEIGDAGNKMIKERIQIEKEVVKYREHLESLVTERTAELEIGNKLLQEKNADLERFNSLFIDREFRIKELKETIKNLEAKLRKTGSSDNA